MKIFNPFNYLKLIFGSNQSNYYNEITYPTCSTLSGYNNLTDDDKNPGCIKDGCGTDLNLYKQFLTDYKIVAIHDTDWNDYQYYIINVTFIYKDKTYTINDLTIFDVCADSDCGGCCTENAKLFCDKPFLIDIEATNLKPLGIPYDDLLVQTLKLKFVRQMTYDEVQTILKKYGIQ